MSNLMKVARVIYQDENGKELNVQATLLAILVKIDYSTRDTIAKYLKQGYKLVENEFDKNGPANLTEMLQTLMVMAYRNSLFALLKSMEFF